mmetsp:Transcript_7523/g.17190  ORF Transcript_7523/g.17190 Transcript_7523/m.17190 type:complete len:361 (-) Transcript_7523:92-1174(-)
MLLRVQVLESGVLELAFELPDTEPVCERREDVERLPRDGLLLVRRHVLQRPHVVQPVRELDDDDPEVLAHRDEHLPQVLRLLVHRMPAHARPHSSGAAPGLSRAQGQLGQLAHLGLALHDPPHRRAEQDLHLEEGQVCVLDRVVQQPRDHRVRVHAQPRQQPRHRHGVDDEGLPRLALLAVVGAVGDLEAELDALHLLLAEVADLGPQLAPEPFDRRERRGVGVHRVRGPRHQLRRVLGRRARENRRRAQVHRSLAKQIRDLLSRANAPRNIGSVQACHPVGMWVQDFAPVSELAFVELSRELISWIHAGFEHSWRKHGSAFSRRRETEDQKWSVHGRPQGPHCSSYLHASSFATTLIRS